MRLSFGFLAQSNHVSSWIAEPGGDFERIGANGLHNLAAAGGNRVKSRGFTSSAIM
jgi:hypothetical protein